MSERLDEEGSREDAPGRPSGSPDRRPEGPVASDTRLRAAVAILGVTLAFGWYLHGRQIAQLQDHVAALSAELAGAGPDSATIDIAKVPFVGSPDAKVTLVEFSDYECPFCVRHFQQTMPQIGANYIKTGKIRYVFQDFPIDENHPEAIKAHEAAHCALEQNKFWELHMKLFTPPGSHKRDLLEQRATEAGLDLTAFRGCMASGRTTAAVRQTSAIATRLGANGTPAFFIGVRDPSTDRVRVVRSISGSQPYQQFAQALDEVLAKVK